jgi:hypothetical protein
MFILKKWPNALISWIRPFGLNSPDPAHRIGSGSRTGVDLCASWSQTNSFEPAFKQFKTKLFLPKPVQSNPEKGRAQTKLNYATKLRPYRRLRSKSLTKTKRERTRLAENIHGGAPRGKEALRACASEVAQGFSWPPAHVNKLPHQIPHQGQGAWCPSLLSSKFQSVLPPQVGPSLPPSITRPPRLSMEPCCCCSRFLHPYLPAR